MALFLFLLAKVGYLPTALFVALRPLFSFWQVQYAQVFLLKPVPFCKLFGGLGSTNKSATFLLLSYSLCSRHPVFSIFPFTSISGRSCLLSPPVLSGYDGFPDTCFFGGMMRLMSWPDRERYLRPLQFLVVSLSSFISTFVFSQTGGILSHLNSLTHRFLQFPLRNLCSLVMLTVSSHLHCNRHSLLLGSYLSRIGRIENPSCSACGHQSQDVSHLILYCPATDSLHRSLFGDSLSLDLLSRLWKVAWLLGVHGLGLVESRILPAAPVDTSPRTSLISFYTVQLQTLCTTHSLVTLCLLTSCLGLGKLPGFWGFMVFCHAPIAGKGLGNNNNRN